MNCALYITCLLLFPAVYNMQMLRHAEKQVKLPNKCGLVSTGNKVTNGKDAGLGQFPFMALLGFTVNVFNHSLSQFCCGGSIINEKHVLTAAHCFNTSVTFVRLGELNLKTEIDCSEIDGRKQCADPHIDVPIERNIIHADYNPSNFKNDIALVRLARKVSFTEYIQPICLPLDNNYNNLIKSDLIVSGWGKTVTDAAAGSLVLQSAMVNAWSTSMCENVLTPQVRPQKDTQLCANGMKGQDACAGDSGGPLFAMGVVDFVGTYFQVGVVSFAATSACGNSELPSVYTRVDKYIDWIIENI